MKCSFGVYGNAGSVGSAGIVAEAQPSQPASRGSFLPGLIGQARSRLRSISWRPPRPSDELVPKVPTALLHTPERSAQALCYFSCDHLA